MFKLLFSLISSSVFFSVTFLNPQITSAQTLNKYCNLRYGFCVNYPTNLAPDHPPQNGDGQRFFQKNGLNVIVSGSNNVLEYSLEQVIAMQKSHFDQITYEYRGKSYFILSGYHKGQIIYIKTYVGLGAINSLWLDYPTKLKTKYNPLVTKISQSFTPGNLDESH